jgi:hypothetical protein
MAEHTEYRLSWEMPDMFTAADLEARFGRDLRGHLSDEEWDALPWKAPTVRITTDPWDQYNGLKQWAETREQPIRNVRLERRVVPDPGEGWEPV